MLHVCMKVKREKRKVLFEVKNTIGYVPCTYLFYTSCSLIKTVFSIFRKSLSRHRC